MTDYKLKPLDPDVASALAGERARPGPGPDARRRAHSRLQAALLAPGDSGGGSESRSTADAGAVPDLSPPSVEPAVPGSALGASVLAAFRAHPFITGGVGFFCGLASGVALHARLGSAPEAERSVPVSPPISTPVVVASVSVPSIPPPAPMPVPVTSAGRASKTKPPVVSAAAPASGPGLATERALLDLARAARMRGDATAALEALAQHQNRFAGGVFREEREALTVLSLRDVGRVEEARQRGLAFRARYPKSLFLTNVERVLLPAP